MNLNDEFNRAALQVRDMRIEALQHEVSEWRRIVNHLTDQRDALEKDAMRYRWLRSHPELQIEYTGELTLDEYIDKEME